MEMASQTPTSSTGIQYSLRTLLIILGIACLLLTPSHWFGAPYLVSAGFSVALILLCVFVYRSSGPAAVATSFFAAFGGFLIAIALLVFFFHAVLNAMACLILTPFKPRLRTFALVLAALMVAVYGFAFYQARKSGRRFDRCKLATHFYRCRTVWLSNEGQIQMPVLPITFRSVRK